MPGMQDVMIKEKYRANAPKTKGTDRAIMEFNSRDAIVLLPKSRSAGMQGERGYVEMLHNNSLMNKKSAQISCSFVSDPLKIHPSVSPTAQASKYLQGYSSRPFFLCVFSSKKKLGELKQIVMLGAYCSPPDPSQSPKLGKRGKGTGVGAWMFEMFETDW